jgi:dipeptidyl aminopeptidase/acylaminoacyl peptidase
MSDEILNKGRRKFIGASLAAVSGAAVVSSGLLPSAEASAQTNGAGSANEPMVIGYPNKKGIQIEHVTYPARNMGTEIAAYIFKPAGFDKSKKYPSIIVTHPFGGVKEQTSGLYSAFLAEQGFVTLAFDKSYQGESGGEPRLMSSRAASRRH